MQPAALARKYRPQNFEALIGQEPVVRVLQNAVKRSRIHSAYMFTGTRGVGKTSAARIFAKSLNCESGPTPDPCGNCVCCTDIAAGHSVDVQEIDAASHTKVEETRELMSRVAYAPAQGRYRVFIIDEAHMLSKSSFNALLKTLEEPPDHAVFILATTEPQKILETVRSRCIEFSFRRIPAARIEETLQSILGSEGIEVEAGALGRIALSADGSMRDALSLTDQILGYADGRLTAEAVDAALGLTGAETVAELWEAIFSRDAAKVQNVFREAYRQGSDLRRLGIDLIEALRALILAWATDTPPASALNQAYALSFEHWSATDLHRMFDRLHRALVEMERTPVPDILLETVLLRLAVLEPLGRLESVLDAIAGGAGNSGASASSKESGPSAGSDSEISGKARPVPMNSNASTSRSDDIGTSDVVHRLLEEVPSLRPMLSGNCRWIEPELVVTLPSSRSFAMQFLEERQDEIVAVLRDIAGPEAILHLQASSESPESAASSPPKQPVHDKRKLLEDERLRLLLKAFPGAEVVDIRFQQ